MEDNSYVSLSIEKYNELYDKAKKFDELSEKLTDVISENINKIFDNILLMLTNDNEEHSEETEEFKIGDKVKLVKLNDCTFGFSLGDICTITRIGADGDYYNIEITDGTSTGYVDEENIEKIKEEK